jgi:Tfp pilus assembly ATPase PilU
MQTFDQSIFALYQAGYVTLEEALRWASNVDEFKLKVQGISTSAEMAKEDQAAKTAAPAAKPAVKQSFNPDIVRFGG